MTNLQRWRPDLQDIPKSSWSLVVPASMWQVSAGKLGRGPRILHSADLKNGNGRSDVIISWIFEVLMLVTVVGIAVDFGSWPFSSFGEHGPARGGHHSLHECQGSGDVTGSLGNFHQVWNLMHGGVNDVVWLVPVPVVAGNFHNYSGCWSIGDGVWVSRNDSEQRLTR